MSEFAATADTLMLFLTQPRLVALMVLVTAAALIDWQTMRIPNWLTAGGVTLGLLMSVMVPPTPQMGFTFAVSGLALGLVLMLPMYLLGVMGAGDVKLMAMVGTYLGVPSTLHAVLFVFVTGGVLALATVLIRRAWAPLASNLKRIFLAARPAPEGTGHAGPTPLASMPSVGKLPYGVSICVGTLVYVISNQLGYF